MGALGSKPVSTTTTTTPVRCAWDGTIQTEETKAEPNATLSSWDCGCRMLVIQYRVHQRTSRVHLSRLATVADLKNHVREADNVQQCEQRLFFNDRECHTDSDRLVDLGARFESEFHIMGWLPTAVASSATPATPIPTPTTPMPTTPPLAKKQVVEEAQPSVTTGLKTIAQVIRRPRFLYP